MGSLIVLAMMVGPCGAAEKQIYPSGQLARLSCLRA